MNTIAPSRFAHGIPLFLAPMEGITNAAYRRIADRVMTVDVICTEFVRISGKVFHPQSVKDVIEPFTDTQLSVQLMGDHPELLAETVPYFEELGADIIDLNLGCPSTTVTRKGCGAAMLTNRDLLTRVVSSIRDATTGSFSCKIRAGWEDPDQAVEIAAHLESLGIDLLVVHPRTRMQRYDGNANRAIIKAIATELSIPVIGNGDIFDADSALDMLRTGCAGIMCGRGVLQDPFLLNKINHRLISDSDLFIPIHDYLNFYNRYITELRLDGMPDVNILNKLKEHFSWFTRLLFNGEHIWNTLKRTQSLSEFTHGIETLPLQLADMKEEYAAAGTELASIG